MTIIENSKFAVVQGSDTYDDATWKSNNESTIKSQSGFKLKVEHHSRD